MKQLYTVTLTIRDRKGLSGKDAYKQILIPFLDWLKSRFNLQDAMWRVEISTGGILRYHIATDGTVDDRELKDKWRSTLYAKGLIP